MTQIAQSNLKLLGSTIKSALPKSMTKCAHEIGISVSELFAICNGTRKKPNPLILRKIEIYLKMPENSLVDIVWGSFK